MALTSGFKKFIGLVAVVALVGGGIYAYKQMPKAPPATVEATPPVEINQESPAVAERTPPPATEPELEAEPAPKKSNSSTNRGLDAVLNAGKK